MDKNLKFIVYSFVAGFTLAFWAAAIYVVSHFVMKYW